MPSIPFHPLQSFHSHSIHAIIFIPSICFQSPLLLFHPPFIHPSTHPLIHSFVHLLFLSFLHSFNSLFPSSFLLFSPSLFFFPSFSHSFIRSLLNHVFIQLCVRWFFQSFVQCSFIKLNQTIFSSNHSFVPSFVHLWFSWVHRFFYLFIHSSIQSVRQWLNQWTFQPIIHSSCNGSSSHSVT